MASRVRRIAAKLHLKAKRLKKMTLIILVLLVIVLVPLVRVTLENLHYLLVLPYSQFAYPLEIDFKRLLNHYETHGAYPSDAAAINNSTFPLLHSAESLCSLRQGESELHLLILVKSSLKNRHFRDLVRATWANRFSYPDRLNVRHAFVLGAGGTEVQQARINAEQAMHADIVQQGFVDAYFNNTYKTMFAFDWAAHYCRGAAFVLFVDDDYYISPPNLGALINQLWHRRWDSLALGYVFSNPVPKRSPFSRWFTTLSEYPYAFWPPYPTGGAVLVTASLCRRVSVVQRFVRYLRFDDVFVGIVMRKLGLAPEHHGLFYYELLTPLDQSVYRHVIAMHLDRRMKLLRELWVAMNYTWHDVPVLSMAGRGLLSLSAGVV